MLFVLLQGHVFAHVARCMHNAKTTDVLAFAGAAEKACTPGTSATADSRTKSSARPREVFLPVQALLRELEQPGMALLSSAAAQAAGVGPNPGPGGRSAENAARQADASVPAPAPAAALLPLAVAPAEERARLTEGPGPAPAPAAGSPPPLGMSTEERTRLAAEERCALNRPFQPHLGAMRAQKPRASEIEGSCKGV